MSHTETNKPAATSVPQGASIVPLSAEPMARGIVEFFGGPRGRFASRPANAMAFIASVGWIFLSLAYLAKANCAGGKKLDNGLISLNWDGNRQYTSFCYNDIIPLYQGRGLNHEGFVYAFSWQEGDLTRYMEYPVLAGMFQWIVAFFSRLTYPLVKWAVVPEDGWYFALTALVMSIIWVITLRMVAELAGTRRWDALLVAASPLVVMHAFTNWDIPSIAFAVAALTMAKRRKNVLAGVFIGLGTAFKLWPLFLLGAFIVLAIRNRAWMPFLKMLAAAIVSWVVVNLPIALKYPDAWGEFYRLNSTRGWEWTTVYAVLGRRFGFAAEVEPINTFSLVGFLLCCAAIAVFGIRAARQPRVAEMVYLIVMCFLLFNKVWSPQYSLWLLVPAALALPNWRLIFSWGLVDALVWPILMWHMMGADQKGAPGWLLDLAIIGRDALIITIGVLIIAQMRGKREDKVLAANGTDLLAGDFGSAASAAPAGPADEAALADAAVSSPSAGVNVARPVA